MFRNQYLVTNQKYEFDLPGFRTERFGEFHIHVGAKLKFTYRKIGSIEIAILGILFDPLKPSLSEFDILRSSFNENSSLNDFLKDLERFSGRFVFLFKNKIDYFICGDFRHSKKIIYSSNEKHKVVTSSLSLFYQVSACQPDYDPEIKCFAERNVFIEKQQDWPGEKTIDKNFKRLLPNHCLEVKTSKAKRIPIYTKKLNFEEVIDNTYRILSGTYEYLTQHYKLIQPITAGWDSRILLGASLKQQNLIKYYVFRREDNKKTPDIFLSQEIASQLGLNFSVYDVEELHTNFLDEFKKHNLHHHTISKLRDIQYHYDHHREIDHLINVSGICGNLMRSEYGQTNKKVVSFMDICCLSPYGPYTEITRNEIKKWYEETKDYAVQFGISMVDLYFIEIRMGNWGSIYSYEQDIALEEIDPFSNKKLMYPILMLDKSYRGLSKSNLSERVLSLFDKRLLEFPINPDKHFMRKYFTNEFEFRSLSRKIKHFKQNFIKRNR